MSSKVQDTNKRFRNASCGTDNRGKVRYRTKKYILNTLKYTVSLLFFSYLYIFLAHIGELPALFEKYTGPQVRNATNQIYETQIQALLKKMQVGDYNPSEFYYAMLDTVTAEPVYRYTRDLLQAAEHPNRGVPPEIKDDLESMVTYPALLEWLKSPKGGFAEVFKYEFTRYVRSHGYIRDMRVVNTERDILWKTGAGEYENGLGENYMDDTGFSRTVKANGRLVGYLQGKWDPAGMLNMTAFSHLAYGAHALILDSNFKVINPDANLASFQQWMRDSKYIGPLAGREDGVRFIHQRNPAYTILIAYPAPSWVYYFVRLLLGALLLGLGAYLYFYISGHWNSIFRQKDEDISAKQLLHGALQLNAETLHFTRDAHKALVQFREAELEKIALIGGHLTYMHKKLNDVMQNNNLIDRD